MISIHPNEKCDFCEDDVCHTLGVREGHNTYYFCEMCYKRYIDRKFTLSFAPTAKQILKLKPGCKLDALVGKHFFGLDVQDHTFGSTPCMAYRHRFGNKDNANYQSAVPCFSESWDGFGAIYEKGNEEGWVFLPTNMDKGKYCYKMTISFCKSFYDSFHSSVAAFGVDMPHAMCLAALLVLRARIDDLNSVRYIKQ